VLHFFAIDLFTILYMLSLRLDALLIEKDGFHFAVNMFLLTTPKNALYFYPKLLCSFNNLPPRKGMSMNPISDHLEKCIVKVQRSTEVHCIKCSFLPHN